MLRKNKRTTRNKCSSDEMKQSAQIILEKVIITQIKVASREGITIFCWWDRWIGWTLIQMDRVVVMNHVNIIWRIIKPWMFLSYSWKHVEGNTVAVDDALCTEDL